MNIGVYAMARSGHHAVFAWINSNHGSCGFVNHENPDIKTGKGPEEVNILVVRDPYNWLASWLTSAGRWRKADWMQQNTPVWIERYKDHCREALGLTNYLGDVHIVNYNSWFLSQDYREQLGSRLKLPSIHKGLNTVSAWGGGSTWDGMNFQGRAQEMKVMTRWKRMKDNAEYRQLTKDSELQRFGQELFNMAPVVFNG